MRRGSDARTNPVVRTINVGAGVTLSPYMVGMHFHRWPEGSPLSAPPAYGFGTARSHDYGGLGNPGMGWNKIHTAAGTYGWTTMDTWVNTHHAAGRKLVYTLYGTPAYLRTSDTNDLYGNIGGASVPSDSATGFPALQAFITAFIDRYNDGTPSGRKIAAIEAWNEPKFDGLETGFWWGTAAQMADIARAVRLGINASVDPDVAVWSPGFIDGTFVNGGLLDTFLAAESAQAAGTYGRDWIDEIAVHIYSHGYDNLWRLRIEARFAEIKAVIAKYPSIAGMPWHVSEQGGAGSSPDPNPQAAWTPAQWGLHNARYLVYQCLIGAQSVCLYSHDGVLSGDYAQAAFAEPLNRAHTQVAGKTITQAQFRMDGSLELIADGGLVRI